MKHAHDIAYMIIPTVLIPLTFISVGISVVATFIAGLFGVHLKNEGPKQLLEVLLKPKVLISALLFNLVCLGAYRGYLYIKNYPAFEWTIQRTNVATPNENANYPDFLSLINVFATSNKPALSFQETKEAWAANIGSASFSSPSLSGNSLFLGSDDGYIYEADVNTGSVARKFFIGTPVTPTSIIYNNFLYVGEGLHDTHHARIYKINLKTGAHDLSYQTKGHTEGSPYIATFEGQTLMFVPAGKDGLHAVDPNTMKAVWIQRPGHIDSSVAVEDGRVYTGMGREKINTKKEKTFAVAYDFKTGKEIWKNEISLSSWMKPVITGANVCFSLGEIYFSSQQGALQCYNKLTGEPLFSILNNAPILGMPFAIDNDVVFNDYAGKVCRVNILKREISWCFETKAKGKQMNSVAYDADSNLLALSTFEDGIYFLDVRTGKNLYHYFPTAEADKWNKTYASILPIPGGWLTVDMKGKVRKLSPITSHF